MSEPEIARRCTACGVSVRQSAMFCPQCGNPLRHETTTSAPTAQTQALHAVTIADHDPNHVSPTAPTQALHQPTSHSPGLSGVAENVRERVEKIKHVSHVVIDQAAYDPSLRFLLVAVALFLLFIMLVIVSKVLG
ncbi:MAG TPA: zinc ribbon domain-containing protein [Pyrinomonadaceae bacterium]|nr:zinc ribbon domain-containing protein [Pyrinomonadaceae bacterium]